MPRLRPSLFLYWYLALHSDPWVTSASFDLASYHLHWVRDPPSCPFLKLDNGTLASWSRTMTSVSSPSLWDSVFKGKSWIRWIGRKLWRSVLSDTIYLVLWVLCFVVPCSLSLVLDTLSWYLLSCYVVENIREVILLDCSSVNIL